MLAQGKTEGIEELYQPMLYHMGQHIASQKKRLGTVWSERFVYKVAPPELEISPSMYFSMYNSIVQSKVPKIIVPLKQNLKN